MTFKYHNGMNGIRQVGLLTVDGLNVNSGDYIMWGGRYNRICDQG